MSLFIAALFALAAPPDAETHSPHTPPPHAVSADRVGDCARMRLKPFVSPYGIQQAWPVMTSPPPEFLQVLGTPLSDMGHIADGYQQFLHIDERARAVYVVEQGGFAGTTKVYGPLPLPRCTPSAEKTSPR